MALQCKSIKQQEGNVIRVTLRGELDTLTAPDCERELEAALRPGIDMLILDMKELSYISSAGLRVVFKIAKQAKAGGVHFALANRQPQIVKVFDIVKALPDVNIFRNEAELDAYLTLMQEKTLRGGD
ncbi:MAG TPA: STAS domain-containing protein [Dongiaceae bacterium]|nr:STAS domain-containing protein [Dongiaceae bacterium]